MEKSGEESPTSVSSKKKLRVHLVLHFTVDGLGRGSTEGKTMERQVTNVDREIRRKLVQMYEEEDSNDELGRSIHFIAQGGRVFNFCYHMLVSFALLKIMSRFTELSLKNFMEVDAIVAGRK